LGRRDREAMLLCAVGKVLADQGADGAEDRFAEARRIAEALDDGFLAAFVLEHQGYYAQARGDYTAARAIFAEEAEWAARIDDDETRFFALLNLGSAEHKLDRLDEALAHHRAALALAQARGNPIWQAHALQSMGEDHHRLGDTTQARQCLNQARTLFHESGMQAKVAEVEAYMQSSDYPVEPA
jgi:tetratricopeptide (TPR) repeat protein